MDDKLYAKIKLSLLKFDFTKHNNFGDLYTHSKQFKHGRTFKAFVKIVQNMGVSSRVIRTDEGLKRVLIYDQAKDKYLNGEVMALQPCPDCSGSGVVSAPVNVLSGSV